MGEVSITAKEALERLAGSLRREARRLAPHNVHDAEDIEQAMCLGVLEAGANGSWPMQYYKKAARGAALKHLERHIVRNSEHTDKRSLSEGFDVAIKHPWDEIDERLDGQA